MQEFTVRFTDLEVRNLRAVERFEVHDLTDFVMIAGQNGSGKSCVFDAIRLLKSLYGGHQADEHMQWFGEFSISVHDKRQFARLFRDPAKPVLVSGTIEFAEDEAEYLQANVRELAWSLAWQRATGQRLDPWTFNRLALASQIEQYKEPVDAQLDLIERDVKAALSNPTQTVSVQISPGGEVGITPCRPAEVAFQSYRPEHLGVIEYHSASRTYGREQVGGINLDARQFADQRRQQMLYNWQAKYQNVKTELATAYVRNLIAGESGAPLADDDLNETLVQLFQNFFPDKAYGGVRPAPDGGLEFPVTLSSGETHDIDDLSSGEKEILYGYLRLRNSTPRNSVVLLDEPELHLNPGLLQGFPDFYHQHIGQAKNNQLWLVTHSDTLLRQTLGNTNYRVYHMQSATALPASDNQAVEVVLDDDVERATVDLVGDLAAYRPHAKVVILEGETPSGIDQAIVRRLFPEISKRVNLVSGGPKRRVRDLYRVLAGATESAGVSNRFFAIVDRDRESGVSEGNAQEFMWDRYHIENYLLDPASVRAAAISLTRDDNLGSDEAVRAALKQCALLVVEKLVLREVQEGVHNEFSASVNVGVSPDSKDVATDIQASIARSIERVAALADILGPEQLTERVNDARTRLLASLEDDTWMAVIPGREILRRFAEAHVAGVKYETLANVILDRMADAGLQPKGMKKVLEAILEA